VEGANFQGMSVLGKPPNFFCNVDLFSTFCHRRRDENLTISRRLAYQVLQIARLLAKAETGALMARFWLVQFSLNFSQPKS
jgi:hypothetical protein